MLSGHFGLSVLFILNVFAFLRLLLLDSPAFILEPDVNDLVVSKSNYECQRGIILRLLVYTYIPSSVASPALSFRGGYCVRSHNSCNFSSSPSTLSRYLFCLLVALPLPLPAELESRSDVSAENAELAKDKSSTISPTEGAADVGGVFADVVVMW